MPVKLVQLRSSIALADAKSFHRASQLVCRSQPARLRRSATGLDSLGRLSSLRVQIAGGSTNVS